MYPIADSTPRRCLPLVPWALILAYALAPTYPLALPERELVRAFDYLFGMVTAGGVAWWAHVGGFVAARCYSPSS